MRTRTYRPQGSRLQGRLRQHPSQCDYLPEDDRLDPGIDMATR